MGQLRKLSAAVGLMVVVLTGCGADDALAPAAHDRMASLSQDIIGTQRDASKYTESVKVLVNNEAQDWCTGTIIAPRVVLTAAHCVAFNNGANDGKTWTIIAPFATTTAANQTQTTAVGAGEVIDPAMWANYTRETYYNNLGAMRDIGLVYLTTPIPGVTYPTLTNTQYKSGTVSAIGRQAVSRNAGLVLSAATSLSGPAAGYAFDNQTKRLTDGGDSGGGLFLDGTHTIVGTESNFDDSVNPQQDYWMRLDGGVYTFIQSKIASHGGNATTLTSFRDQVSSALCNAVSSCCTAQTPGYALNSTQCKSVYNKLGFDATARGISNANAQNVWLDESKVTACLSAIGNLNDCSASSADMTGAVTACVAALNGRVATGGSCAASLECAGNTGCSFDAFGAGTCKAFTSSCQVLDIATTTVDQREQMGQELCAKMAGTGTSSYCSAYNFAADAYKPEATWTCQARQAAGADCDNDQYCSSFLCDPSTYKCSSTAIPFVNTAVCTAFKN